MLQIRRIDLTQRECQRLEMIERLLNQAKATPAMVRIVERVIRQSGVYYAYHLAHAWASSENALL